MLTCFELWKFKQAVDSKTLPAKHTMPALMLQECSSTQCLSCQKGLVHETVSLSLL